MISELIFAWCLSYLCFEVYARHLSSQYSQESSDNSQCIFNVPQKIYNVTDLLRCMDELTIDLFAQDSDRSLKQKSNSLAYRENSYEFPFGNMILNLFNNGGLPSIQNFPLDSIINNDQLNYPSVLNEPVAQFGGLGTNLLNAVSSISRHDDLKCVSRILCEVASGNPPGEYKQASTRNNMQYLRESGRNVLTQWLARLTIISPVLSFARAAMLGYSSNGNPAMCYQAFPRCPRNPDKLVHYLNNHNGGFFRFFNGVGHGSYLQSSYASRASNSELFRRRKWKAPPPGIAGTAADRTGTGKLKFDIPVLTTPRDYEKSFFPKENTLESSGQIVFPDEDSNDHPLENKIPKSLSDLRDSDVNTFSQDSSSFFPQESEDQNDRVLLFTSELSGSASRNTIRFPD